MTVAVLPVFIIILVVVFLPRSEFIIYNKTKDCLVYKAVSVDVLEIYYKYQQSYDRGLIEEKFILDEDNIIPTTMIYDTDSYDYHGSRYKNADYEVHQERSHVFIHEHPGYPEIRYRVGYTIEQEIRISTKKEEKTFLFQDIGDPGDLLLVTQLKR